ncbi:MAG: hypothetical protein RSC26_03425 [Terrisporobacter sp.]
MEKNDRKKIYYSLNSIANEYETFNKVLLKILKNSCSKKTMKRITKIFLLCLIFLPLMNYISSSDNTYNYIINLIDTTDSLMIPLFTSTLGGYALFQALTSGNTLISFLKQRGDEMSKFEEFNLSFLSLILGYILILTINYLLKNILPVISDTNWINVTGNYKHIVIVTSIFLYVTYNIFLLLEMRSFIFNLFQCFNLNVISHGIKALKEDKVE